jgi:16S rRNA (adenine1518-N6/adenine1519-N6)-dimethyltransferase
MNERYTRTRSTLLNHNLAPKKALGQNFLVHRHTAQAIVEAGMIGKDQVVVEVGVGLGALTHPLAAAARHVYGYEIDRGIVRMHSENNDLPENVTLVHEDILEVDFEELSKCCEGKLTILANLPYSITNPFLFKLIDNAHLIDRATIMVQKEVADRLTASPGSKEYGVPTILLACCATVKQVLLLKPAEFHPRPKIDSAVIAIDFFPSRNGFASADFSHNDFELLKKIVRAAFGQRRKTLTNSLSDNLMPMLAPHLERTMAKNFVENLLISQGLSPQVRPEMLTVAEFIALCKRFSSALEPKQEG